MYFLITGFSGITDIESRTTYKNWVTVFNQQCHLCLCTWLNTLLSCHSYRSSDFSLVFCRSRLRPSLFYQQGHLCVYLSESILVISCLSRHPQLLLTSKVLFVCVPVRANSCHVILVLSSVELAQQAHFYTILLVISVWSTPSRLARSQSHRILLYVRGVTLFCLHFKGMSDNKLKYISLHK